MRTEQLNVGFLYFNQQDIPKGKVYVNFMCGDLLKQLSELDLYFFTLAIGLSPNQ